MKCMKKFERLNRRRDSHLVSLVRRMEELDRRLYDLRVYDAIEYVCAFLGLVVLLYLASLVVMTPGATATLFRSLLGG